MKQILILLISLSINLNAQRPAIVKAVHDGDSYKVQFFDSSKPVWVRLVSVDCPEVISNRISANQPMGVEVGDTCRKLLLNDTVIIKEYGYDRYGRILVKMDCQYDLGTDLSDISEWLLLNGYAVYLSSSKVHPDDRLKYRNARTYAKNNKLGIWKLRNQLTPYQWRSSHKK